MKIIETEMKSPIIGEMNTVETIPTGAKEPKKASDMGQVASCAPKDADREPESIGGKTGAMSLFIRPENTRMPARAAYESMNATEERSWGLKAA